jgi:hypothetical protein
MNFEQLKTAWQASVAAPPTASALEHTCRGVRAKIRRQQHAALLRRIYGTAAFILALAMLAALAALPGPALWPGMRVAFLLWSASLVVCVASLWRIRRDRHVSADAPLAAHLEASLGELECEMTYYRALRWIFWLPLGAGFGFAMAWQAPNSGGLSWFLILGVSALWLWGLVHSPRHWIKQFEPQRAQLEQLLRETRHDPASAGDS